MNSLYVLRVRGENRWLGKAGKHLCYVLTDDITEASVCLDRTEAIAEAKRAKEIMSVTLEPVLEPVSRLLKVKGGKP